MACRERELEEPDHQVSREHSIHQCEYSCTAGGGYTHVLSHGAGLHSQQQQPGERWQQDGLVKGMARESWAGGGRETR